MRNILTRQQSLQMALWHAFRPPAIQQGAAVSITCAHVHADAVRSGAPPLAADHTAAAADVGLAAHCWSSIKRDCAAGTAPAL